MFNVKLRFESKGHLSLREQKCLNVCLLGENTERDDQSSENMLFIWNHIFSLQATLLKGKKNHFQKSFLRGGFEFKFSQEICHILLMICGEISLSSRRKCQLV